MKARTGGVEGVHHAAVADSQSDPTAGPESLVARALRAGALHLVRCAQPNTQGRRRREDVHAAQAPPVPGSPEVSGAVLRSASGNKAGAEGVVRGARPDHRLYPVSGSWTDRVV